MVCESLIKQETKDTIKYVYDELHGFIPLNELELKIIDTPTFQRLRRIKQLAQAWYVYPGAVHTRFSHSLGTFMLAKILSIKLVSEGLINNDDAKILKIASLLHDIGHTPYSHALEEYFSRRYGISHEDISKWVIENDPYITEVLDNYGIDPKEVSATIQGLHKCIAINELLSSDVDVDRLDYLLRDALHTGVAYGLIDKDRIVQTLTIDDYGYVAIPAKSVQAIESFYIARLHMYRAVYYHKTITAYQLLMGKIYELMCDDPVISNYLQPFTDPKGIKESITKGTFYLWDDYLISGIMANILKSNEGSKLIRELVNAYINRRGYRVVYEELKFGSWEDNGKYERLSELIRDKLLSKLDVLSDHSIIVFYSFVPIFSDEEMIRVLSGNESIPIRDYESTIIRNLPEVMYVIRVYSLRPIRGKLLSNLRSILSIK